MHQRTAQASQCIRSLNSISATLHKCIAVHIHALCDHYYQYIQAFRKMGYVQNYSYLSHLEQISKIFSLSFFCCFCCCCRCWPALEWMSIDIGWPQHNTFSIKFEIFLFDSKIVWIFYTIKEAKFENNNNNNKKTTTHIPFYFILYSEAPEGTCNRNKKT